MVLACEHASRYIPRSLHGLGLDDEAQRSHAAWDIGAEKTARALSDLLDAPLVAARISRLVYDCNRPPDSPAAMLAQSERFAVPGNRTLTEAQRAQRINEVFEPFSTLLADTLAAAGPGTSLVTVHSFTPVYDGRHRSVEIGILHDSDPRLANAMLASATAHTSLDVRRNDPYGPEDGVTCTLRRHGVAQGRVNVMIEIRNDLVATDAACTQMASMIAGWLKEALKTMETGPGVTP